MGLLAALVGGAAWVASGGDESAKDAELDRVIAFQDKLFPLAEEWGKIEIQGMRPAIADLAASVRGEKPDPESEDVIVPPETVAAEAQAWQSSLAELRRKIAAVPAPRSLVKSKLLFDQAIVRYIDAAKLFEQAATGPVSERQAGIDKGIEAATDGARLYNEASILLQSARRRVGLSPTADFPDQPAGEQNAK